MPQIKATTRIAAPPERVFALFTDLPSGAANVSAIEKIELLTDGPIGKGTRFRETRTMFGRSCSEVMEIVEFDPPRSYTFGASSCGCLYRSQFTFRPEAGGTVVDMTFNATAQTFMAKLMSPMFALMASTCRKAIEKDMTDLKAVAEGAAPGASPAVA